MKGFIKAAARTPHQLTSRVGMSSKSQDPETNELVRRFTGVEDYAAKLIKDSQSFRDAVMTLLTSSSDFASSFSTVFQPLGNESSYDVKSRYPAAGDTIDNLEAYQGAMAQLREDLAPELELIDSRILAPVKEFVEILKKVRKTIVKRDHKLLDYDRHNNSYSKLRDKKDKSLKDEQSLFKAEQDFEVASEEYNRYNDLIKQEVPALLEYTTAFITPLFHSFYFMQLNVIYNMYNSFQQFSGEKFSAQGDVQSIYLDRMGDTASQVDSLAITKRIISTARMMSTRQSTLDSTSSSPNSALSRANTTASTSSKSAYIPPSRSGTVRSTAPPLGGHAAPPPPYAASSGAGVASVSGSLVGKRPPPPAPPKPKPKPVVPAVVYVTALYDFQGQQGGDLSFSAGDRIELVERTGSTEDWWTGKVNGQQGVFPGNYVQEDQ